MTIDLRIVFLGLGVVCLLVGIVMLVRLKLKTRDYTATVNAKLVGYEDIYETTQEGVQTISQRVYYPIFIYEVDGVSYKKSTSRQFYEQDEKPEGIDVPIRYNPRVPSDCYITYEEYPMLTPVLVTVLGAIVTVIGLIVAL